MYTLGKSGDINNLLLSKEELEKKEIQFFNTNRGGDITCHGPGQIVCYPILDLDNFFSDIHKYLRYLEEVVIQTLNEFGIKSERSSDETGVWIEPKQISARKICAMGVKASRWDTMHGFALNVDNDLSYYNLYFDDVDASTLVSGIDASTTSFDVSVSPNTLYYWRVTATDENGNSSDSGTYTFRVQ